MFITYLIIKSSIERERKIKSLDKQHNQEYKEQKQRIQKNQIESILLEQNLSSHLTISARQGGGCFPPPAPVIYSK